MELALWLLIQGGFSYSLLRGEAEREAELVDVDEFWWGEEGNPSEEGTLRGTLPAEATAHVSMSVAEAQLGLPHMGDRLLLL